MSSCEQDKKGERTDKMFQTEKHELILSIPIINKTIISSIISDSVCTYKLFWLQIHSRAE